MNIFLYTILFIMGLLCGSFAALAAYRIPLKISLTKKAFCEHCRKPLKFRDQIPLLSYIYSGGRCRYCKKKINRKTFWIELFVGFAFILMGLFYDFEIRTLSQMQILEMILGGMYITVLTIVILIDLEYHKITDESIIFGIIAGILNIGFKYIYDKEFYLNKVLVYLIVLVILLLINTLFTKKRNRHQNFFNTIFLVIIISLFTTEIATILTIIVTILTIVFKNIFSKIFNKRVDYDLPIAAYLGISSYIVMIIIYLIGIIR